MDSIGLDDLSLDELRELIGQVAAKINDIEMSEATAKEDARVRIENATTTLVNLLGPENATPALGSIRGVLAHGDSAIEQNSALVAPLIVRGLETLTATMIEITKIARQN